jgi:hypothetical protein
MSTKRDKAQGGEISVMSTSPRVTFIEQFPRAVSDWMHNGEHQYR